MSSVTSLSEPLNNNNQSGKNSVIIPNSSNWKGHTLEDVTNIMSDKSFDANKTKTDNELAWRGTFCRARTASSILFVAAMVMALAVLGFAIYAAVMGVLSTFALPLAIVGIAASAFLVGSMISCTVAAAFRNCIYEYNKEEEEIIRCWKSLLEPSGYKEFVESGAKDEANKSCQEYTEFTSLINRKLTVMNERQEPLDYKCILSWFAEHETALNNRVIKPSK